MRVTKKVIIIGIGEMGSVFARGFLRDGFTVIPVTRSMEIKNIALKEPNPDLVILAVAENDLQNNLESIPAEWKDKLVLLQNELLPKDWLKHELISPTIISVWFEKKKGQDVKVIIPSPVYGAKANAIQSALGTIDIPVTIINSEQEMEEELILKNVYILTTNIAGLECGGTVESLWNKNNALALEVANEVMDIQSWLVGKDISRKKLIAGFAEAILGDLNHKCMGRSAPARLNRALELADKAKLTVSKLREIKSRSSECMEA